ncbi:MAG TPA: hypothetical protein PKC22_01080 [Rhodocyclaceae bacterium]|nr:hypothetical protein [Rhodocyclaceae bacterium]
MLSRLKRDVAGLATFGGHVVLALIAYQIDTPSAWRACLAAVAALSLLGWTLAWRRQRVIADTPTSRIASAAQGYVELHGRAQALEGIPVVSPINGLPCLWYRYRIERRSGDQWLTESQGESDASFVLDDGSGLCLIDPEGAEFKLRRTEQWTQGERRYTQSLLLAGSPLYVLGNYRTLGSVDLAVDHDEETKSLLASWKADPAELRARFDHDQNGEIDLAEWEQARAAARREVEARHRDGRAEAELHTLGRPHDGRLFLISDIPPERLLQSYRLWSAYHLIVLGGSLVGLARFA